MIDRNYSIVKKLQLNLEYETGCEMKVQPAVF